MELDCTCVSTTDFQFTLEQDPAIGANAILLESERGRLLAEDGTTSGELIVLESSDMTTASGSILTEEGDFIIQEDYILGDMSSTGDSSAQNELFDHRRSVLDFSESNPFGDVGVVRNVRQQFYHETIRKSSYRLVRHLTIFN